MFKIIVLSCLVYGSLAQWSDPDWAAGKTKKGHGAWVKFPQLPRSYPIHKESIFDNMYVLADEPSTVPTTSVTAPTDIPTVTTGTPPTTTSPKPDQCTGVFSCADCNTAQVCRPTGSGFVVAYTLPCPTTAPYCDYSSGTCSTVPNSKCGSTDSFFCTADGYFPDPSDCTVYHTCNNYEPKKFKCADQQTYDPEKKECRTGAPCLYTVNCTSQTEVKFAMADTHYFTYCSTGKPLLVSRCDGDYKLNTTSQVCEPICERNGLMADLADCTKFYQCTTEYINPILSVPIRKNLACPAGEAFDPASFQCIPKEMTTCKN